MRRKHHFVAPCLILLCFALASCGTKKQPDPPRSSASPPVEKVRTEQPTQPVQLPVRYQLPGYVTAFDSHDADLGVDAAEHQIKVGATIRSTGGPQPLWDVLKRLANLKGMTVSWASDVNPFERVDVDIAADDDFFKAIDNLLRQIDYFRETRGKTIIVRYKDTKVYHLGVPAVKGQYNTTIGGNFLASRDTSSGTDGIVKIQSDDNTFDLWGNVEENLNKILAGWKDEIADTAEAVRSSQQQSTVTEEENTVTESQGQITSRSTQAYFSIDRNVGIISVTAPKTLIEKFDSYIETLKKSVYQQVSIEAKIIEVYLQDNSRIGLDWSNVLKDFSISGTTFFGTAGTGGDGQVYPWIKAEGDADSITKFVSKLTLNSANFEVFLNALNEQGDTHVLANPKLTVLNGQPAIISIGRDITYVKRVVVTRDRDLGDTYSPETDNIVEGIALGVMASIVDNQKVILHLTPITTELVGKEIAYRSYADGTEVGVPQVNVRQMSTMVEVGDGEMLVIGGLIDSVESTQGAFMPLVGSIPVIKYLFGVEEKIQQKRELVILLTPTILNASAN